jgi:uncharacterized protein YlxP (DUF503 family)
MQFSKVPAATAVLIFSELNTMSAAAYLAARPVQTRGAKNPRTMPIARLTIELEIPHAQSLKDRRQVVRSIKDKLRHGFNLSIAELDEGLVWNRATLGIAAISSSHSYLTGQLQLIDDAVHRLAAGLSAEVLDSYGEVLP